ncbi:sugar ABC transporter permease [Pantoea rwandensis]|uniref:Transport permease protein n=2 Tax=Pantoea rwandensis TaxID=1076550 RepID=A0A1X1CWM3_9GAMM|nr:sugar ABC transporter permease [Pantoea rwandensis]
MLQQQKIHGTSLWSLCKNTHVNRHIIFEMTKRDIISRYKGSIMGLLWSFINPIFMLAVYTLVFSEVFNARWGTASANESKAQFAIILFAGLIVHGIFSEVLTKSPVLILNNVNYVKKVVFPLESFPVIALLSACFQAIINTIVLLLAFLLSNGFIHWTVFLFPLVFVPVMILTLALSYIISSLGVYLRDLGQFITLLVTVILFLSPVFYPLSAVPEKYQSIILLNPLTFIIEQMREIIIWGRIPDLSGLLTYTLVSLITLWFSYFWFQKTRKGFADVI